MCPFKLHYWPVFTSLWIALTFTISYVIAVLNDHVYPLFPYISDTGATVPESCIFGQMLNIAALFMFVNVYIRHRVVLILEHKDDNWYRKWNWWSNIFGGLSCLGMSVVANFQETSVPTLHIIGASLAFGIGAIYFMIQSYITWLTGESKFLKYFRIVVSGLLIPLYVVTTVFQGLSFSEFDGDNQFKWNQDDVGYNFHLVASFSEWALSIFMMIFIISYTPEFKYVKFDEIVFVRAKF